jgi:hypothetical protein
LVLVDELDPEAFIVVLCAKDLQRFLITGNRFIDLYVDKSKLYSTTDASALQCWKMQKDDEVS